MTRVARAVRERRAATSPHRPARRPPAPHPLREPRAPPHPPSAPPPPSCPHPRYPAAVRHLVGGQERRHRRSQPKSSARCLAAARRPASGAPATPERPRRSLAAVRRGHSRFADHLGQRGARARHHRGAAGQRFQGGQAEGLDGAGRQARRRPRPAERGEPGRGRRHGRGSRRAAARPAPGSPAGRAAARHRRPPASRRHPGRRSRARASRARAGPLLRRQPGAQHAAAPPARAACRARSARLGRPGGSGEVDAERGAHDVAGADPVELALPPSSVVHTIRGVGVRAAAVEPVGGARGASRPERPRCAAPRRRSRGRPSRRAPGRGAPTRPVQRSVVRSETSSRSGAQRVQERVRAGGGRSGGGSRRCRGAAVRAG